MKGKALSGAIIQSSEVITPVQISSFNDTSIRFSEHKIDSDSHDEDLNQNNLMNEYQREELFIPHLKPKKPDSAYISAVVKNNGKGKRKKINNNFTMIT